MNNFSLSKSELEDLLNYEISDEKFKEIQSLEFIDLKRVRTDLTFETFERLFVLGRAPSERTGKTNQSVSRWWCICSCPEHTILPVRVNNLTSGNTKSCNCLNLEKARERILRLGTQFQGRDLTGQHCGELTALHPTDLRRGNSVVWMCKCNLCGREDVQVSASEFGRGLQISCGCLNESKGSFNIKKVLKENNIEFITEYTFPDCKFADSQVSARFDFYLPQYNRLIEFDGIQHYKERDTQFFKDSLDKRQQHDEYKNQYCKEHNIDLVRIPYWKDSSITLDMLLGDEFLI